MTFNELFMEPVNLIGAVVTVRSSFQQVCQINIFQFSLSVY